MGYLYNMKVRLLIQCLLMMCVAISADCIEDTVSKTDYGDSTKLVIKTSCSSEYYKLTENKSKYMLSLEYFAPPFEGVKKATEYIKKYIHVDSCGSDTIVVGKNQSRWLTKGCGSVSVNESDGWSRAKNGKQIMMMGDLMDINSISNTLDSISVHVNLCYTNDEYHGCFTDEIMIGIGKEKAWQYGDSVGFRLKYEINDSEN
jgi:hypothetical protein